MSADPSRQHWHSLTHEQQIDAIHRMAAAGVTEYGIAHATGLSVELIRRILQEMRRK